MKLNLRQLFDIVGNGRNSSVLLTFQAKSCMAASRFKAPWTAREKLKTTPEWYGWFSV